MTTNPDMRILAWLASVGAAPAADIAAACKIGPRAAGARLRALEEARLSHSVRLLHGETALHASTRRGLSAAGCREYEPTRISVSNFGHLLAVSKVATTLRQAGRTVGGEKELRALERAGGAPLASAAVGIADDGSTAWHRPDLVCWDDGLPTAIEVELTVKAPKRLRAIVRGWARSRLVGAVIYYATPAAARALASAVAIESAQERITVVAFERAVGGSSEGAAPEVVEAA